MTAKVSTEGDNWIFTIPKSLMSESYVQKLLDRLAFYELTQMNELTPDQAWELSETVKEDWWQANRERILAKMGIE